MTVVRRTLGVLALTLSLTTPASAETILLTSGAFNWLSGGGAATVTMSGGNFSFTGNAHQFSGVFSPWLQCQSPHLCVAGSTIDLFSRFLGADLSGTATYNGVTYNNVGSLSSNSGMDARWSGGLLIPSGFNGGAITGPFAFAGEFHIQGSGMAPGQIVSLNGAGRATLNLTAAPVFPGAFNLTGVRYEFDSAAPVPEPTSMLLIGTGMAGLAALRRRRERGKDAEV